MQCHYVSDYNPNGEQLQMNIALSYDKSGLKSTFLWYVKEH